MVTTNDKTNERNNSNINSRDPNPKDNSLMREQLSTYKGFHSTLAALFSHEGVVVRVRVPLFATHERRAAACHLPGRPKTDPRPPNSYHQASSSSFVSLCLLPPGENPEDGGGDECRASCYGPSRAARVCAARVPESSDAGASPFLHSVMTTGHSVET